MIATIVDSLSSFQSFQPQVSFHDDIHDLFVLQCCFLIYCMMPTKWNGSTTIYNNVIRPFVLKHQKEVDEALDKAADLASDVVNEGVHLAC